LREKKTSTTSRLALGGASWKARHEPGETTGRGRGALQLWIFENPFKIKHLRNQTPVNIGVWGICSIFWLKSVHGKNQIESLIKEM
jgi:hypothetical protein